MHIQNGVAPRTLVKNLRRERLRRTLVQNLLITGGEPDEHVPIVFEIFRVKLFVTAELAIGRVHLRVLSV
jgi:hypothetical protein